MKLIARIDIAQAGHPGSFGTVQEPIREAIEDALVDLRVAHPNGFAYVASAEVTIEEGDA